MKIAFVTPRYGEEVIGGAEHGARMLAERLAAMPDWTVEALSTCALSSSTWANWYPSGDSDVNGVMVRRFPASGRDAAFDELSTPILSAPHLASPDAERQWIERQGPVSWPLIDAIRASDADLVAFYPYLYHPTVVGIGEVGDRAVLHAAAHDEAPIHLPCFRSVFAGAAGLVFHTEHERRLVERVFPVAHHHQIVMGLGADAQPGEAAAARAQFDLGDRPYLLCLGRVDDGKGTKALAHYFAQYKARNSGPLSLVFAGPVVHQPPQHRDIVVTGAVDEYTKWGLLRGATACVSPSAFESFSIVLIESWNAGVPVLVNGRCSVTREHVQRSGGGLAYENYWEFEVALDTLSGSTRHRSRLAERGAAYVDAHYRWDHVMARYVGFLEGLIARRNAPTRRDAK